MSNNVCDCSVFVPHRCAVSSLYRTPKHSDLNSNTASGLYRSISFPPFFSSPPVSCPEPKEQSARQNVWGQTNHKVISPVILSAHFFRGIKGHWQIYFRPGRQLGWFWIVLRTSTTLHTCPETRSWELGVWVFVHLPVCVDTAMCFYCLDGSWSTKPTKAVTRNCSLMLNVLTCSVTQCVMSF